MEPRFNFNKFFYWIVEFFPASIVKVKNFPGDTSKIIANDVEQLVSDKLNCLTVDVGTNE